MLSGERARLRGRRLGETARYGRPLSDRTAARHRPATLYKAASGTFGCWAAVETRREPLWMGRLSHALMSHTTLGFYRRPSRSFGTKNNDVNKLRQTVTCSDNNSCTKSLRDSSWLTALIRGCAGVPGWTGGGTWCAGLISPLTCGREKRTL